MSNRIPRKPKKPNANHASPTGPVCLAGDLRAFPQGHIIRFFHTDKEMLAKKKLKIHRLDRDPIRMKLELIPGGGKDRFNIRAVDIERHDSFTLNGEGIVRTYEHLKQEIFIPGGFLDPQWVDKRLGYLEACLIGSAKDTFKSVFDQQRLQQVNENSLHGTEERRGLDSGNVEKFYAWLKEDDDVPEDPLERASQVKGGAVFMTGDEYCTEFEHRVWFQLYRHMWRDSRQAYDDQLRYLEVDIVKPRVLGVLDMLRRVEQMFRLQLHLPPPSIANQTYESADWGKRDTPATPQMIRRVQHNALPEVYKEALRDETEDWKIMEEPKWLDKLQRIEQKEKAAAISQRTKGKYKRTDDQSDSDDSAPVKHAKKKRREKKQPARASGAGTARWCTLCKEAGYSSARFNSHHTNQCKADHAVKQSGSFARRNEDTKSLKKEFRTMQKLISKLEKNSVTKGEKPGELKKFHKKSSSKKKKKAKRARRYTESSSSESEESDDSSDDSSDSDASEDDRKPRATR